MAAEPLAERHLYEVGLWVGDDNADHTYEIDHRFPQLPELETLKLLRDEAVHAFETLHGRSAEQVYVHCNYLEANERGDDNGTARDRATA